MTEETWNEYIEITLAGLLATAFFLLFFLMFTIIGALT